MDFFFISWELSDRIETDHYYYKMLVKVILHNMLLLFWKNSIDACVIHDAVIYDQSSFHWIREMLPSRRYLVIEKETMLGQNIKDSQP